MFDLTLLSGVAIVVISFIGGICGGVWGIGAGWVVVPVLLLLGVPAHIAVGCSIVHMAVKSIYPVYKDWGRMDWSPGGAGNLIALPMIVGSVLAVFAGVSLLSIVKIRQSASTLVGIFYCVVLAAIVIYGLCERRANTGKNNGGSQRNLVTMTLSFITGLVTGVLAGLLGIGGGLVRRPALTYLIKTKEKITGPIGQLTVLLTSLVGIIPHWANHNLQWDIVLLLCAGGFFGQAIGNHWRQPILKAEMDERIKMTYLIAAGGLLISQILNLASLQVLGVAWVILLGVAISILIFFLVRESQGKIISERP